MAVTQAGQSTDALIERLQSWVRGVDAIILGSGASADYGYPLMAELAKHLLSLVNPSVQDESDWNMIANKLRGGIDLETALTNVQISNTLLAIIVEHTWRLVSKHDLMFHDRLVSKNPDFPLSQLIRWFDTGRKRIDVITTNYDRVVEFACDLAGVTWIDGTGFGHLKRQMRGFDTVMSHGRSSGQATLARIWKVHGSLDWFSENQTEAFMATSLRSDIPGNHLPLVVTPGQAKYERSLSDPFRSILVGSDDVVRASNTFLCIGYGFNDRHVHEKLISKSQDRKTKFVVLAKTLSTNAKKFLIDKGCKNYIAIERGYGEDESLIWSSGISDPITIKKTIWSVHGQGNRLNVLGIPARREV